MSNITELPRFIGAEEYQEFFFKCEETETSGRYVYNGATPGGGSKLVLLFVDKTNAPCAIEKAAFVEIQEKDETGSLIHVEHGKADKYEKWSA